MKSIYSYISPYVPFICGPHQGCPAIFVFRIHVCARA